MKLLHLKKKGDSCFKSNFPKYLRKTRSKTSVFYATGKKTGFYVGKICRFDIPIKILAEVYQKGKIFIAVTLR